MTSLVEQLGHAPDARLLIVTCDDLGTFHAANAGVYQTLRDGIATSAALMVPCPWARGAVSDYRGEDVGVQLTLNAEMDIYRWGPLTHAPSLLDGDGGFPRTVAELWDHADLDEVRRECRTQIERAIVWGFDVSHLGTHMNALALRPEFFDIYLDLAVDFDLPLRLPDHEHERTAGFPFRRLAREEGIVSPDHVISTRGITFEEAMHTALVDFGPGVTEIIIRPAIDSPELGSLAPHWLDRAEAASAEALSKGAELRSAAERGGAVFIGYRQLRELQRSGSSKPSLDDSNTPLPTRD